MVEVEGKKSHGEGMNILETKGPRLEGEIRFREKEEDEESFLQSLRGGTRTQI